MTDNLNQRPVSDVDTQVGQAWSQHYRGQSDEAIKLFRQILEKWPEHVDANYGLALALKAVGQKQQAGDAFRKTKGLIEAALNSQGEDNVRYQMLSRMIDQHLTTL
jgi:Flp pilus assembly protein TadD